MISLLRSPPIAMKFTRHANMSLGSSTISDLQKLLGNDNVRVASPSDDLSEYTCDWTKSYSGGSVVVFPTSTEELSSVMKYCNSKNIQVVPQGGNTSLTGGAVPVEDELIVNLKKLNRVIEIDSLNAVLIAESGCILENLNLTLQAKSFMMPFDLGAKGSCMLGGNVATNAGGLRFLRYGSMHHNVLGLEVVLADGTVLNMLSKLRKDNTGFPLKHMFIGSEGCLGIISKVALQIVPLPKSRTVVLVKLPSFDHLLEFLRRTRGQMGEVLSAFEFFDDLCIQALKENMTSVLQK